MTDPHIPPEVIEAFRKASGINVFAGDVAAGITAALAAWPGMKLSPSWDLRTHERRVEIVLPIIRTEART